MAQTLVGWILAELLSFNTALTSFNLRLSWVVVIIGSFAWARRSAGSWLEWLRVSPGGVGLYVAAYSLVTGMVAVLSPPATVDSLTYHMARVAFWIQYQSCYHYPTTELTQLAFPPLAEISILNLHLLAGSDWPANLVQWQASLACLLVVYGLGGCLELSARARAFAVFWLSTVPMFYMQSSSTQNDLVVSCGILTTVYFFCIFFQANTVLNSIPLGLCLGMAALSKGTAFIVLAPYVITIGAVCLRRKLVTCLLVIASLAFLINAHQWSQNIAFTGGALGSKELLSATRARLIDLKMLVLGPLRQLSLNLGAPLIKGPISQFLLEVHRLLGVAIDDPRITYDNASFVVKGWLRHEDGVGSPTDGLLLFLGGLWILRDQLKIRSRVLYYAGLWAAAGVLFSVLLKWQPWGTRLQLPLFCLAAPLAGQILSQLPTFLRVSLISLRLIFIVFLALWNENRPILSASPSLAPGADTRSVIFTARSGRYYVNCLSGTKRSYSGAIDYLRSKRALNAGLGYVEFPYLLFVAKTSGGDMRLDYVMSDVPKPEFIIASSKDEVLDVGGCHYSAAWSGEFLTVYALKI